MSVQKLIFFKKTDDFHTPRYSFTNTAMNEKNASLALGLKKYRYGIEFFYSYFNTELGILRGSHIGNLPDLEAALKREIPLFTEDFNYAILNRQTAIKSSSRQNECLFGWR